MVPQALSQKLVLKLRRNRIFCRLHDFLDSVQEWCDSIATLYNRLLPFLIHDSFMFKADFDALSILALAITNCRSEEQTLRNLLETQDPRESVVYLLLLSQKLEDTGRPLSNADEFCDVISNCLGKNCSASSSTRIQLLMWVFRIFNGSQVEPKPQHTYLVQTIKEYLLSLEAVECLAKYIEELSNLWIWRNEEIVDIMLHTSVLRPEIAFKFMVYIPLALECFRKPDFVNYSSFVDICEYIFECRELVSEATEMVLFESLASVCLSTFSPSKIKRLVFMILATLSRCKEVIFENQKQILLKLAEWCWRFLNSKIVSLKLLICRCLEQIQYEPSQEFMVSIWKILQSHLQAQQKDISIERFLAVFLEYSHNCEILELQNHVSDLVKYVRSSESQRLRSCFILFLGKASFLGRVTLGLEEESMLFDILVLQLLTSSDGDDAIQLFCLFSWSSSCVFMRNPWMSFVKERLIVLSKDRSKVSVQALKKIQLSQNVVPEVWESSLHQNSNELDCEMEALNFNGIPTLGYPNDTENGREFGFEICGHKYRDHVPLKSGYEMVHEELQSYSDMKPFDAKIILPLQIGSERTRGRRSYARRQMTNFEMTKARRKGKETRKRKTSVPDKVTKTSKNFSRLHARLEAPRSSGTKTVIADVEPEVPIKISRIEPIACQKTENDGKPCQSLAGETNNPSASIAREESRIQRTGIICSGTEGEVHERTDPAFEIASVTHEDTGIQQAVQPKASSEISNSALVECQKVDSDPTNSQNIEKELKDSTGSSSNTTVIRYRAESGDQEEKKIVIWRSRLPKPKAVEHEDILSSESQVLF